MAGNLIRKLEYPVIDGIRCYAAFVVFMVHFCGSVAVEMLGIPDDKLTMRSSDPLIAALAYLADGHHGVDAFFIVSGFLMARVVGVHDRGFEYWNFISRRARRIFPAFLATLVLATLVRCLVFDWPFKPGDFALNLVFANALPEARVIPYNAVSWSLGYEFAFYLIIPVLRVFGRASEPRLAGAALLAAALVLIPDSLVRANGLFVGAFIGCFADEQLRRAAKRIPLWLVLPAYLALVPAKGLSGIPFREFYFAYLILAAPLFVRLVFAGGRLAQWLQSRPIRAMGTISYSFYLLHTVTLALTRHWVLQPLGSDLPPWIGIPLYFAASLLFSVLGAWLFFRAFEQFYFRQSSHMTGRSSFNILSR